MIKNNILLEWNLSVNEQGLLGSTGMLKGLLHLFNKVEGFTSD